MTTERGQKVLVVGAGVFGLWQALTLARAGFAVRLIERTTAPFDDAQSRFAGAMLSPYCEEEAADAVVRDLGIEACKLWQDVYPGVMAKGTLVVAQARDDSELMRFGRATSGHRLIDSAEIERLEPDLAGRFSRGLFYPGEAHMAPVTALMFLLETAKAEGVELVLGETWTGELPDECLAVVDCRGMGAQDELGSLRGVRGERLVLKSGDVQLQRPVRLLHPRHPLYVVPWGDDLYMVGATVIESEDKAPMTVRSALELLGLAYALHPAFGEAEIIEMGAGLRPSFPDNLPCASIEGAGRVIRVNGAYRHGFLLAPLLARTVCQFLAQGEADSPLLIRS